MDESYQAYQMAKQKGNAAVAQQFDDLNGALAGAASDIEGSDAALTPAMYDMARHELVELAAQLQSAK